MAQNLMTFIFANLSFIKLEGENKKINGSKIIAFMTAVRIKSISPSYVFKRTFCMVILCARSTLAFKNAIAR